MSESRSRLVRIVETGIMIALAVALSFVKIWEMPQGGSVTLGSMVPILLVAIRYGVRWGVMTGVIAGIVQHLVDPGFYYPIQWVLDYPVAFGALGLAGLAQGRSRMAAAWLGPLALAGRFVAHVLAGGFFFAEWAPEGMNPWVYSIVYNGTYMLPEVVISGLLLMALLPALDRALPTQLQAQHH